MTNIKLPSVLAFDRKLEPSDALMYSCCWKNLEDETSWQAIELFERRNRAVKSNFKQEILADTEELNKQIAEANLAWGDDASLFHDHDTLKLSYTLRVVSGLSQPSACNKAAFEHRYSEKIKQYTNSNLNELASRYAYNIANGRFLWRNRVGAQDIIVRVNHVGFEQPLKFNAYDYSLNQTQSNDGMVSKLAKLIHAGLSGSDNVLLKIDAYVRLGDGQRVWPSQEMVLNTAKGEKSRHLFSLNGIAAMHCEKIGNALRTIDDWFPNFSATGAPIAIEAYGSVTQRGMAYRSSKTDFKTLLLKWLNAEDDNNIQEEEKHFVVAMLIRGGVFGEGE